MRAKSSKVGRLWLWGWMLGNRGSPEARSCLCVMPSHLPHDICHGWSSSRWLPAAEYIMRNAGLDEAQAGIRIARRNINNLRYADDTTVLPEIEEELKSLLMKVKEESEKAGLKLSIQKVKIMTSCPITSWQIDGETVETVYFLGLQNHCRWCLQP